MGLLRETQLSHLYKLLPRISHDHYVISCQSCHQPGANWRCECERESVPRRDSGLRLPISCQVNAPKMLIKHKHTRTERRTYEFMISTRRGHRNPGTWQGRANGQRARGALGGETGTLKLRQRDVGKLSARVVLMNSPAHPALSMYLCL